MDYKKRRVLADILIIESDPNLLVLTKIINLGFLDLNVNLIGIGKGCYRVILQRWNRTGLFKRKEHAKYFEYNIKIKKEFGF